MNSSPPEHGELREELRGDVQKVADAASERFHDEADTRKAAAVDQAKTISSAFDKVAGEMGSEAPAWLKTAFSQGALSLNRLADAVDHQDSRQLVGNVKAFARDNPGSFLAGCAALGFAAARVFKAGEAQAVGNGDMPRGTAPDGWSSGPINRAVASGDDQGAESRPAVPLATNAAAAQAQFQG